MKKIIALAIASAFVAPVVMADATVYGSLRTALQYDAIKDGTAAVNVNRFRLVDQSSRLGFKGSDKLDNGLTVLWQSEHRVRVGSSKDDGSVSQVWGERDTFVGIQGDFGMVRAGRFDDTLDNSKGDFFNGAGNVEETSSGVTKFNRRGSDKPNNVIQWQSPKWNGFAAKAQYDFGSKSAAANAIGYAASVYYQGAMFDVGAAYKQVNDATSAKADAITASDDFYKSYIIGANLKLVEGLDIGAAWNRVKVKSGANTGRQDGWGLGANYKTGKYVFALGYGQLNNGDLNGNTVSDSKVWGLNAGMTYNLSKQTKLLGGFNYIKNGDKAGTSLTSTISNGTGTTVSAGAKVTSLSVGIRTDF